jgi:enoyl-CoA hydratase
MNKAVETLVQGPVTIVTLQRPDVRNAVDADTAQQLYAAFAAFEADPSARVAVFHGAHGHFCAGWDLQAGARMAQQMQADVDPLAALDFSTADYASSAGPAGQSQQIGPAGPMGPSRLVLAKPVIAAISGAAVAGGMELALWCDMRVMEDDAYFGVYCRRFGVPLIDGGTVRLPRLIGMGHAMDLILTGRKVEAAEALQMGLCNRVVPTGQALQAAVQLAEQIAAFPQKTMLADRASAYAQWDLPLPQALHQEWQRGKECIAEGLQGAGRFTAGAGRHGKF